MLGRLRRGIRYLQDAEQRYADAPDRPEASIARETVLAIIDPVRGHPLDGPTLRPVVAGALLLELVHAGRLSVTGRGRKTRVTLRDDTPLGDPELDEAMLSLGSGIFGSKLTRVLHVVPSHDAVRRRLVADGLVEERSTKSWGIVDRRYHPTPAAGHDALRARVHGALVGTSVPDPRTALLICVLATYSPPRDQVEKPDRKQADRRAEELLQSLPEAEQALVSGMVTAVRLANRWD